MTDRINSFLVVLKEDTREDDAEAIKDALQMVKGVLSVEGNVAEFQTHVAYARARHELEQKLWKALHPDEGEL